MFHYLESIQDIKGNGLVGYFVGVSIPDVSGTGSSGDATIYADDNSTPIIAVSGVDNRALVDTNGMASLYIVPGTYHVDIYAPDAVTFINRLYNVPMLQGPTGDPGPTGPAGDVAKADTRTALSAITGQSANATRWLAESGRQGTFMWLSGDYSTQVASDPLQGVFVPMSPDPLGTAGKSGAWVRQTVQNIVTPGMFGAGAGYASRALAQAGTSVAASLQAMYDFVKSNRSYIPSLAALYWPTNTQITINYDKPDSAIGPFCANKIIGGAIVATTGSTGTDLVVLHFPGGEIEGQLQAHGTGDVTYSARGWLNGIKVVDSCNMSAPAGVTGTGFKRWGAYLDVNDMLGNPTGNNIAVAIGPSFFWNCGSSAGQTNGSHVAYTFDSVTLNGTTNSFSQTSVVHFTTALDPNLLPGDAFAFTRPSDGKRMAFIAQSIDFVGNTITFYFWLPNGVTSGSLDGMWGGGLYITGSNTAYTTIGRIYGLRCGTTYKCDALYGATVDFISSEVSGCNKMLGSDPSNASIMHKIKAWHSEATYLDYVECGTGQLSTSNGIRAEIGPASAMATQTLATDGDYLGQCFKTAPRVSGGDLRPNAFFGAVLWTANGPQLNEGGPAPDGAPATTFTVSNKPHERTWSGYFPGSQSPTVNVKWYPNHAHGKLGQNWIEVYLTGIGARNELTGTLTVGLDASLTGYTLNGGSSALTFTNLKGPARVRIVGDLNTPTNLRCYVVAVEPQGLVGTSYNGDSAITLNAATSTKTQTFNTPLTANRAVTLSTTNARNGDRFRIVRNASATGAFNVNVGTGPLKALTAAGQWCDVEFDGTAWALTGSGSL